MNVSNNPDVKPTSSTPASSPEISKAEYQESLIKLFKDLDSNGDNVLDSNDKTVKILEDILQGKVNNTYSYDEMAKYVILRNMNGGSNISLENVSARFEEVYELCEKDEESQKLMTDLKDLFQKYSIDTSKINKNAQQIKENSVEEKCKSSYENYCKSLKEKNLEIDITYEEFKNTVYNDQNEINEKLSELENTANKFNQLSKKVCTDQDFLLQFGTIYPKLRLRIQTLEAKAKRQALQGVKQDVKDFNSNTAPEQKNNGPHFGLN